MRVLVALMLSVTVLAGCASVEDPFTMPFKSPSDGPLSVYVFEYPGSQKHVEGTSHGHLVQVSNSGDRVLQLAVALSDAEGVGGALLETGMDRVQLRGVDEAFVDGRAPIALTIPAGESRAFLVEIESYLGNVTDGRTGAALFFTDGQYTVGVPLSAKVVPETQAVTPGDHVQTLTVGVWANGTSFYTNIPELLADPSFPAGGQIDREAATTSATPLPIYVYGQDRTEQPRASRDNCYFTTITGYNALLREQTALQTGITGMRPEDAYTVAGAEEHFLYGEPLAFLNTVVVHEGEAPANPGDLPDVDGDCFDAERYSPLPFPDVPLIGA